MNKPFVAFLALMLAASWSWAQEQPKPKPAPEKRGHHEEPPDEEEDLTPEKALAMLKEVNGLMGKSEELLNDSAKGKALATEAEIVKKLKELLKEESDSAAIQKQILEKIAKLMQKSEGSQKDAIERMAEIIRKAKS